MFLGGWKNDFWSQKLVDEMREQNTLRQRSSRMRTCPVHSSAERSLIGITRMHAAAAHGLPTIQPSPGTLRSMDLRRISMFCYEI